MHAAISASATAPLVLTELPGRALGAQDVRVAVRAIGVNPVDWKMREGGPLRFAQGFLGPSGPLVVGIDFAGVVVERGARVTELEVGDRVVGGTDFSRQQRGSYADEVVVRPDQCVKLPDGVDFERAACLPVAAVTPWIAMQEHTRIGAGSRVLVLGATGGVGLFGLQLARLLGARAVGVCSTRNVAVVEREGAIPVDYTAGDALARAARHGPYHLVLHAVGTDTYPLAACRALLSREPGEGPLAPGVVELVVVRPADYLSVAFRRDTSTVLGRPTRARLGPLVDALARGALVPTIAERLPLADAERAHALSRAGRVVGKILLFP